MFNMGVKVMRPAFYFEPTYRVTMLTKEKCSRGPGTPPIVKGLVWYTDGSRMWEGNLGWSLGEIFGKKTQYLSRKIHHSFPGQDMCYLGLCS
jgi:hypothetical protein